MNGGCGYLFHDSCWSLLEKAFHPTPVPCVRLYELCQSLPKPLRCDSFSWGHDYGGLVAIDDTHYFPWEDRERPLEIEPDDDLESDSGIDRTALPGEIEQDDPIVIGTPHPNEVEDGDADDRDGAGNTHSGPSISGVPAWRLREDEENTEGNDTDTEEEQSHDEDEDEVLMNQNGPTTSGVSPSQMLQDEDKDESEVDESDDNDTHRGPTTTGVPAWRMELDQDEDQNESKSNDVPTVPASIPKSDPYNVLDIQQLLLEDPQPPAQLSPGFLTSVGDTLSRLPEEIRTEIAALLLTSDVFSLRAASKSFWHIFYNQQFWKSRFAAPYGERSWIFETAEITGARDWRSLYRRTNDAHILSSPAMGNRKRVWSLAQRIQRILSLQNLLAEFQISTSRSLHPENIDDMRWTQYIHRRSSLAWTRCVSGDVRPHLEEGVSNPFREGCRIIHKQSLRLSDLIGLSRIAFSFVQVGNTEYLAGLRFITQSGATVRIGYRAAVEQFQELSSPLKGFNLAAGSRGLQAIQCLTDDGGDDELPWFGDLKDSSRTSRLANCEMRALEAGLDVS